MAALIVAASKRTTWIIGRQFLWSPSVKTTCQARLLTSDGLSPTFRWLHVDAFAPSQLERWHVSSSDQTPVSRPAFAAAFVSSRSASPPGFVASTPHGQRFAKPQARCLHGGSAASTEGSRDVILLKGLVFHGFHGVLEEERRLGQKFIVDIEASADLRRAGGSDDLNDTVNYAAVYQDIKKIMEGPPRQLLEAVAQSIADDILAKHPKLVDLTITLKKPHVAIEGTCEYLGIRIHRSRPHGEH